VKRTAVRRVALGVGGLAAVAAAVGFAHVRGARLGSAAPSPPASPAPPPATHAANRIDREGLAVSFRLDEGDGGEARASFFVTDAQSGEPVRGLRPYAWMSARDANAADGPIAEDACKGKIRDYLGGLLSAQADVDMNAYLLWALNDDQTVSVINPQVAFSRTKMVALPTLSGRGGDWAFSANGTRAFVTIPGGDQVAVVDGSKFRVLANVDVGKKPLRIVTAKSDGSVWVGNDGDATVSVVDAHALSVERTLDAGKGHHELAFADEGRALWVTNGDDDALSVYDVATRALVRQVPAPEHAVAVASSDVARAVYVASAGGEVAAFDAASFRRTATWASRPGIVALAFEPTGRFLFVVNKRANTVDVVDSATGETKRTIDGLASPDFVTFTDSFAYVRSTTSERVTMIALRDLSGASAAEVVDFAAGQKPPAEAGDLGIASPIAPTPEGFVAVVANPADRAIYVYREGMMAPTGTLLNFGRVPRSVAVQDRSLKEVGPGLYAANITLPKRGGYDVELLLDTPRVPLCFVAEAKGAELAKPEKAAFELTPRFDPKVRKLRANERAELTFELREKATQKPASLPVKVVFFALPYQIRAAAKELEPGVYTVSVTPPKPGSYTLVVGAEPAIALGALPPITVAVEPAS
jgi:YVTN family beta-propeller protein